MAVQCMGCRSRIQTDFFTCSNLRPRVCSQTRHFPTFTIRVDWERLESGADDVIILKTLYALVLGVRVTLLLKVLEIRSIRGFCSGATAL